MTRNESLGARGRVALLGELEADRLGPTGNLAEKIFSCMLCGACKNICPTGVDIPEVIYHGRAALKASFARTRLMRKMMKWSFTRLDTALPLLRVLQRVFYQPFYRVLGLRRYPQIASRPFNKTTQVYKKMKKISRVAIFAGCSVNYFYPHLGSMLSEVLLARGYEAVVFKGELCCGAPLRSMGIEDDAADLARKNIGHFSKVRAQAIISMCPTCTMVIREQYPLMTGQSIENVMDVNEFIMKYDIARDLEISSIRATCHDPCHLSYGLGIRSQPREILNAIKGIDLTEMRHADECCGFAGLFSVQFRKMSKDIGMRKIENILDTSADTVVTSCPGCIMQIEALRDERRAKFDIRHIVELIHEAISQKA